MDTILITAVIIICAWIMYCLGYIRGYKSGEIDAKRRVLDDVAARAERHFRQNPEGIRYP